MYHKKVPLAEQQKALATMRAEEGWIMVSTDAAARGLDLPSVRHVIQADFAENAVDFLHRIGRTGRAGRCDSHLCSCLSLCFMPLQYRFYARLSLAVIRLPACTPKCSEE